MSLMTPKEFFDEIRRLPKFVEISKLDPKLADHLEMVESSFEAFHEAGNADPVWLDRYDAICALLGQEDMTIKGRLVALCELMAPWWAEYLTKRGH